MKRFAPPAMVITHIGAALTAVGVVAAIAATWIGVVLAGFYRPHDAIVIAERWGVAEHVRRSDSWSDWHARATAVFLLVSIVAVATVAWLTYRSGRPTPRRTIVVLGGSIGAMAAALVTSLTRGMVQWDMLALHAVTVGEDMSGYWTAGFHDNVRSVIVGTRDVPQTQYAVALLVHLGAPLIGATGLTLVAWHLRKAGSPPS
jgi:hypothetical protein